MSCFFFWNFDFHSRRTCNSSTECFVHQVVWMPGTRVKSWRRSYHPTGLCKRHVACRFCRLCKSPWIHQAFSATGSKVKPYQHMHRGVWSKNLPKASDSMDWISVKDSVNLKFRFGILLGAGFTRGGHWRWHRLRATWLYLSPCFCCIHVMNTM